MKQFTFIFLTFLIISCGQSSQRENTSDLKIDSPLLKKFRTEDKELRQAIDLIIRYLETKNVPIDSMYLTDYQLDSIPWEFNITHYLTFAEHEKFEREMARVDSLERLDFTKWIELKYIPPTGNISGHDRWIIYDPQTREINDYLHQ